MAQRSTENSPLHCPWEFLTGVPLEAAEVVALSGCPKELLLPTFYPGILSSFSLLLLHMNFIFGAKVFPVSLSFLWDLIFILLLHQREEQSVYKLPWLSQGAGGFARDLCDHCYGVMTNAIVHKHS